MYQKACPQSSTSALVSAIGFDTIKVFLKNVALNCSKVETPTVTAYSGSFGTSVLMHASHGARGTRWETASLAQVAAHAKAAVRVLCDHITLDRNNPDMNATYNRVWTALLDGCIGRLDIAWDIHSVHMDTLDVVCPHALGEMFTYLGRTSHTWYWGVPGQARRVRVYDKKQQLLDTRALPLRDECTRIELELNGARSVQDHMHIRTLRDLLALGTHEAGRRIREAMDAVTHVKMDSGEILSPLFQVRGRKPKIARKPLKTRGWKAKARTIQTLTTTDNTSIRASVFTAQAEPLPLPPGVSPDEPVIPFSAYPPEVQDEILEHIARQDAEARQQAEDDAELRWIRWWSAVPEADRDLIDSIIAGRIVSVSEAWDEAASDEAGRAWREVADTWTERASDAFYMALELCGA